MAAFAAGASPPKKENRTVPKNSLANADRLVYNVIIIQDAQGYKTPSVKNVYG